MSQNGLNIRDDVIDELILLQRETVNFCDPPNPNDCIVLTNLGTSLSFRFRRGGQRSYLDEAILIFRKSIEAFPPHDQSRYVAMNSLADALTNRYELTGKKGDLDNAIVWQMQVVGHLQTKDNRDHTKALSNLGNMYSQRFWRDRSEPGDLNEAIALSRKILELMLVYHSDRDSSFNNLEISYSGNVNTQRRTWRLILGNPLKCTQKPWSSDLPPTLGDTAPLLTLQTDWY